MSEDFEGIYFSDMMDDEQREAIRLAAVDLNLYRKALLKKEPSRTSSLIHVALVIATMEVYSFLVNGNVRPSGGVGTIVFIVVAISVVLAEVFRHISFRSEESEFRERTHRILTQIEELGFSGLFAEFDEEYKGASLERLVSEAQRNLDNWERLYAR